MASAKKLPLRAVETIEQVPKTSGKIKNATSAKPKQIKYEDKSPGQPHLIPIFESIKALMKPYVKGTMKEVGERGGSYALVNEKPVEIEGRKKDEIYFAGILVQKGYVGFYFMPVYGCNEQLTIFHPDLLKLLKGKSCFHIKKNDPAVLGQIKDALKSGYNLYKERGWI
jgi:hypothetical protein